MHQHPLFPVQEANCFVDDDLLSLEEATTNVDNLVADEPTNVNIRHPPGTFESFGRSGTPSVPPGLGLPLNHPSPVISHASILAQSHGRQTPPVALPIAPGKSVAPSSPLTGKKAVVPSGSEAKKNIKALAVESGLSKEIAKAKSQKVLQDEDFPALNSPKRTPVVAPAVLPKATASKASTGGKKAAEKIVEREKTAPPTPVTQPAKPEPKVLEKKPVPGTLNIAAATKAAQASRSEASTTTDKSAVDRDSAFPALPTPTTASVSSPLTRTTKTLRLVSTPKAEVPSTPAGGHASALAAPSLRTAAAIRPETPASEMPSDSASVFSASMSVSRTNSPPPASKVGSAPVRTTTKSQQRKARKEALKKETAAVVAHPIKAEPEVEIAPIIGRKKKQKKEKEKPASTSTAPPAPSRPATPGTSLQPAAKEKEQPKEVKDESSAYRSTANETTTLTEDSSPRKTDFRGRNGEDGRLDKSDSLAASTPRTLPTPASILQDLQKAGVVSEDIDSLPFFKPTTAQIDKSVRGSNVYDAVSPGGRADSAGRNSMTPTKSIVTEEDQAQLLAGNPVRKVIDGVRILLTPNGDCIRNLTAEEEDRFLELQARIAETAASPAAFVSSRHEAGGGFSLIKGRAVPNGPPGYFPQAPGAYPSDPVNKIQREEAIYYINQYVLPRLNLNARDMSFPKTWSPDGRGGNNGNSAANVAAAAAGLSSLAPWMYGGGSPSSPLHDADTAAPELSYPGPVGAFTDAAAVAAAAAHHQNALIGATNTISGLTSYLDAHNSMAAAAANSAAAATSFSQAAAEGFALGFTQGAGIVANSNNNGQGNNKNSNGGSGSPSLAGAGGPYVCLNDARGPFGNVPLMSLADAEQALSVARKEAEKLDKSLNQFMRKNRRLLTAATTGASGGGGH